MRVDPEEFIKSLSLLCACDIDERWKDNALDKLRESLSDIDDNDNFGVSQLNEALLLCNENIMTNGFFRFIAKGAETIKYCEFRDRINEFRELSMLQYGSFRFAYSSLRRLEHPEDEFSDWLKRPEQLIGEFRSRQKALREIEPIEEAKLYWLGYLSEEILDKAELERIRNIGYKNFQTYLSYDYLDVYVATSMRQKWEFVDVNNICKEIFQDHLLTDLNVRYFDPTLNYHKNSVAKGLIEGLMLKRAKCTLYFAQETDTLGKDSEMATTLAQGKPVIAYIPKYNQQSRFNELDNLSLEILFQKADVLLKQTGLINSEDIGPIEKYASDFVELRVNVKDNEELRNRLRENKEEYKHFIELIAKYEAKFYDKRAYTLTYIHPLRMQLNLNSGVANGVLVCRDTKTCAQVIHDALTNKLKFDIFNPGEKVAEEKEIDELNYRLVERITKCVFRVVTNDEMLTNSFWNLY